jgi:glutamyl-tRNA synthetase
MTSLHSDAAPQTGGVRFAPSPTGRFHIGNLRTAWVSFQFAKAWALPWVVRFEDIDGPRVLAGSRESQLSDMAQLGMTPTISHDQSSFHARHFELFELARSMGAVYPCDCSRREVQMALSALASAPHDGVAPVYSGHCRLQPKSVTVSGSASGSASLATGIAWRFKMSSADGKDDFIIARTTSLNGADGFMPAYHWACAIDDFDGAYDLIVRSSDLAPALPLQRAIQIWLANSLKITSPDIRAFHTSLITQVDGHRLEKRTVGVTLEEMFKKGWTKDSVLDAFEKSFDRKLLLREKFDSSGVAHEPHATLILADLFKNADR